jgi:galacturan 1,4-alpha-galacturonidase
MRSPIASLASALCLFAAFANATVTHPSSPNLVSRPNIVPAPYTHGKPIHKSPLRHKTCYVHAQGHGLDDSSAIHSAFRECNNGGIVALLDAQYIIAKPLDLTFLNAVDFVLQGEISFSPDVEFWISHAIEYSFQGAALFWQLGGQDVNVYGNGTINGNGQAWWDVLATNATVVRPILFGIVGLHGGTVSHLNLINPPNWFHFVANSSNLIFDHMLMTATSNNTNPAKNSGKSPLRGISYITEI